MLPHRHTPEQTRKATKKKAAVKDYLWHNIRGRGERRAERIQWNVDLVIGVVFDRRIPKLVTRFVIPRTDSSPGLAPVILRIFARKESSESGGGDPRESTQTRLR